MMNREEAAQTKEFANQFDAVWMRYVVVHVPDPKTLIKAATARLKLGGALLIEDCNTWMATYQIHHCLPIL